ncbi:MAG: SDR family oxidoreductase [Flavobacteriales bacterium]|nr:SDR family oxidoreductase [Flavobacteriales bacterium]
MRLKNKVTVITGGTSGIGFGIAQEFKKEGAKGAIVGRNKNKIENALKKLGDDFIGISTDVTNTQDLEHIFKTTTDQLGKLDVLVVNAGGAIGTGSLGSIIDTTEEDYDRMMDLNLKSVFFTVQKALPYLNDGASIILIASIGAHKGFSGLTVYSAAKAGVRSFARTFSRDLLDRRIRVNVLSPGTIDTPLFNNLGLPDDVAMQAKKQFEDLIPIKRIGQPREMGRVAVFLASDDSSFLLGEENMADGGVVNL